MAREPLAVVALSVIALPAPYLFFCCLGMLCFFVRVFDTPTTSKTTTNSPVHGTVNVSDWLVAARGNATALGQLAPAAAAENVPADAVTKAWRLVE